LIDHQGLSWTALPGAASYDVVYGDLVNFFETGLFDTSLIGCLASGTSARTLSFTVIPPVAGGFWFLVRGRSCAGSGTWDENDPAQFDSRDYLNGAPLSCP